VPEETVPAPWAPPFQWKCLHFFKTVWLARAPPTWCPEKPTCHLGLCSPVISPCLGTLHSPHITPTLCHPHHTPTTTLSRQQMPTHRPCLLSLRLLLTRQSVWRSRPVCPAPGASLRGPEKSWSRTRKTRRMFPHPGLAMCSGHRIRRRTRRSRRGERAVRAAASLVVTTALWWREAVRVGHLRWGVV